MDDGDVDFSHPDEFAGVKLCELSDRPISCSMDNFFDIDDYLTDTQHHACTHTHTCNPPGHDLAHTHTCFHVHTKILSASATGETDESGEKSPPSSKKRPCGNREAVRRYREKKKAHTASLEDEVVQLRALNQQLLKKLQGQAALEAEVMRLKCLLADIRGRIEGEIGTFPYQKPNAGNGGLVAGGPQVFTSCDFQCNDKMYCPRKGMQGTGGAQNGSLSGQGFGICDASNYQCIGNSSSGQINSLSCVGGNIMPSTNETK